MKKTIIAVALVSATGWLSAAALLKGSKTTVTHSSPETGVTAGDIPCDMVAKNETATIQLSKGIVGSLNCTATRAVVSVAHPQGKGLIVTATSDGGKLDEAKQTAEFATDDAAQSAVNSKAQEVLGAAAGS